MRAILLRIIALAVYAVSFFFVALLMIKFSNLIFSFKNTFLILLHPIIPASLFGFLVGIAALIVNLDVPGKLQFAKSRKVSFFTILALILTVIQVVLVCFNSFINASLIMSCIVYVLWFVVGIYTATSISQRSNSTSAADNRV